MTSVPSLSIDSKSICMKRLIKQTSTGEVPVPSHITALLVPFFVAQNCLVLTPKSVRDTAESSTAFVGLLFMRRRALTATSQTFLICGSDNTESAGASTLTYVAEILL